MLLSSFAIGDDDSEMVARQVADAALTRRFAVLLGAEETLAPTARALLEHLKASLADPP